MNVQAISTAIATALAPLGINVYDYGPDQPHSPAAFIYPNRITYNATLTDDVDFEFVIRFLLSSVEMQGAQAALNLLLDVNTTGSAVDLLGADDTFGNVVQASNVTGIRNYGVVTLPDGNRYVSAELVIQVYA